jgi:hypothetical protein
VAPEAVAEAYHAYQQGTSAVAPLQAAAVSNQTIQESMRLLLLVRAYQVLNKATVSVAISLDTCAVLHAFDQTLIRLYILVPALKIFNFPSSPSLSEFPPSASRFAMALSLQKKKLNNPGFAIGCLVCNWLLGRNSSCRTNAVCLTRG